MSGAACKRFLHLSPGADTRNCALAPRRSIPKKRLRRAADPIAAFGRGPGALHEVNDLDAVSRIGPNAGEHEGSIPSFRPANFRVSGRRGLSESITEAPPSRRPLSAAPANGPPANGSRRYFFNFSRKCLRNLATFGATTAWQYGWYGFRA
jgi:hypothetical protein